MICYPERIIYSELAHVAQLKYPKDRFRIALLSLESKACWYAAQEARDLIILSNTKDFAKFWHWAYVIPLRIKRWLYKFKVW